MRGSPGGVGGVTVEPDPPEPGKDVEVTVTNDAAEIYWSIPGVGEGKVPAEDGKAEVPIPAGAGGKTLFIDAGDPPDVVDGEFEIEPDTG